MRLNFFGGSKFSSYIFIKSLIQNQTKLEFDFKDPVLSSFFFVQPLGTKIKIIQILQTIYKSCGSVLLKETDRAMFILFMEKLKNANMAYLTKTKLTQCTCCNTRNGVVKKCVLLKISHEPYRSCKKNSKVVLEKLAEYYELVEKNKEVEFMLVSALIHILNPKALLTLFERITDADFSFLLMDKSASRPEEIGSRGQEYKLERRY